MSGNAATASSSANGMDVDSDSELRKQVIMRDAFQQGLGAAAAASAVSGSLVLAANKFSSTFRTRLGISGKTALVAMSGLAAFSVRSESLLLEGARDPKAYFSTINDVTLARHVTGVREHRLTFAERTANYIYDYPFRSITIASVPVLGAIFAAQSQNSHIKFSQQVMQTRVYGQASIICILLGTMAFQDYMAKHGRFK